MRSGWLSRKGEKKDLGGRTLRHLLFQPKAAGAGKSRLGASNSGARRPIGPEMLRRPPLPSKRADLT